MAIGFRAKRGDVHAASSPIEEQEHVKIDYTLEKRTEEETA